MTSRFRQAAAVLLAAPCILAQGWVFNGKVTLDGAPPPKSVIVERICGIGRTAVVAKTSRDGTFLVRLSEFDPYQSLAATRRAGLSMNSCFLRAVLAGYESSVINLDTLRPLGDPELPPLKLHRREAAQRAVPDVGGRAPAKVEKLWQRAGKAVRENRWSEAEALLRDIVTAAPSFAAAWTLLGVTAQNLNRPEDARSHYRRAIQADPKTLGTYYLLLELDSNAGQWQLARDTAAELIRLDTGHRYPEARIFHAIACYNLHDLDGAQASATQAVNLPRAEFILGRMFERRRDLAQALSHYRRYIELAPNAGDAAHLRARMAKLESGQGKPPCTMR